MSVLKLLAPPTLAGAKKLVHISSKGFRIAFRQNSPREATSWASSNLFQASQALRPAGSWLDLDIGPVWHRQDSYVFDLLVFSTSPNLTL